jgi:hypothetical protein
LGDHLASIKIIRVMWFKPDGSAASAVVRRKRNGTLDVATSLVYGPTDGRAGEISLTDLQLRANSATWKLLSVSMRPLQQGDFVNGDPADAKWRELWTEILGALVRATGKCFEQTLGDH